nr:hypothetical protein CFP56_24547 [Quercus suber]
MSSYYDNDASWNAPGRQAPREQPAPPSRSNTGSSVSQQPYESGAFASQFEEIDRATDNLMKSGKWFPGQIQPSAVNSPARRDSMPVPGRGHEYGNESRMPSGPPARHHSVSEYDGARPGSAGLQGFYQGQRFPGGRQSEAEQMLQAKRRMAAQRERELRNYHQEQQYNRKDTASGSKSDRAMSPNTMSEDDRRELIARQHRALYGDNASLYAQDGSRSASQSGDARISSAGRGPSPLAFDSFGANVQQGAEGSVQMPTRDRADNATSPASASAAQQASFNLLNDTQASGRTSNSSPGGSPPLLGSQKNGLGGVAPIGTRPQQAPGAAPGLNKRSTTPLTPSSLSYGFSAEQNANHQKDERSTSAASNPGMADKGVPGLSGWGTNSAVWGSGKNSLAVQPSVWG